MNQIADKVFDIAMLLVKGGAWMIIAGLVLVFIAVLLAIYIKP
jgi:hypothetical protein